MSLHTDIRAALRARLQSVVRLSIGPHTDLSLAVSGDVATLARQSGSFVADGLAEGEEILLQGFVNPANVNASATVLAVTAGSITLRGPTTLTTEAAGPAVTVTVPLPDSVAMENRPFEAPTGRPYLDESYAGAGSLPVSIGPRIRVRHDGLYFINLYYPLNIGTRAIDLMGDAVMEAFRPGLEVTMNGTVVVVRSASRQRLIRNSTAIQLPLTVSTRTHTVNPV